MFPTPEETTSQDYARLGLRSGLEVHQQLATDRKLFCRCPAHRYTEEVDAEVLRHMRPTLSELGEYDGTALMEFKTRKQIIYRINRENVCTYELDDAPPFELNDQALEFAIEIALMLGCHVVGEVHIARKQYLDGSIPTGFQRTAIVGLDGSIPFGPERAIRVQQLSVEEDACREVSDLGHFRTYLTDRLSIPLIEVVTKPDMRTPDEVARVAQEIRKLTRSSGRAATGIGSGRQDVNVSIEGGTRIEIKGVPRIPLIPRLVHFEAFRQRALLDIRERLLQLGVAPDPWTCRWREITAQASLVQFGPIRQATAMGGKLVAVRLLPPFAEALSTLVGPGRPFAAEVSDRVRVVACLDALPNILWHPCQGSPLPASVLNRLRVAAGAEEGEAVVLVWGPEADVETAAREISHRCREALLGVPSETRQVCSDGTTGFERILPGPDRMYPDTDLPPTPVPGARVGAARRRIPPPSWEQERILREAGMSEFHAREIAMEGRWTLARGALDLPGVTAVRAAEVLVDHARRLSRAGLDLDAIGHDTLLDLLGRMGAGRIARESIPPLLRELARPPGPPSAGALLDAASVVDEAAIEAAVAAALSLPGPDHARGEGAETWWMGAAMARIGRRAPGRLVRDALRRRIAEVKA